MQSCQSQNYITAKENSSNEQILCLFELQDMMSCQ